MRITDHRYSRDLKKHDLALRMIGHEARTCTIRLCTGLTDDRIRKLYRTYISANPATPGIRRRRGKSPRQIAFFTRSTFTQFEASLLAGVFAALGLLEHCRGNSPADRNLEIATLFCDAFEAYLQFWGSSRLSFEHAWFLLWVLANGEDLKVDQCPRCSGAYVQDVYSLRLQSCPLCRVKDGEGDVDAHPRKMGAGPHSRAV